MTMIHTSSTLRLLGNDRLSRATAALAAVFWGVFFFGLIDLLAFAQGEEFHASMVLSTGWGLLFLVLVAAPLFVRAMAASLSACVPSQIAVVGAALAVGAVLSTSPRHLLLAAAVGVTAVAVTIGSPYRNLFGTWRPSLLSLLVVAVAVLPCLAYAWTSARRTGTPIVSDDTWSLDHWPVQASLALAVLLLAAFSAGRPTGWQIPAYTVTASTAWFAVVCLFQPHLTGSVGRGWAIAMLMWAATFLLALHYPSSVEVARRRPASQLAPVG